MLAHPKPGLISHLVMAEECEINGLQIKHSLGFGSKVKFGQTQNWTWILETSKPAKTKFITFCIATPQWKLIPACKI